MSTTSKLAVSLTLLLFATSTVAAAPAFEIFSGDLQLNGNNIDNIGSLSVNTALTDGNISNALTLGSSASVATGALDRNSAQEGEVLAWDGSQWSPAEDNNTDNQTLTVDNDTSGTNDQITISNGNTVTVDDAYEAQASAGQGLLKSSNAISIGAGPGITVNADSVNVDASDLAGYLLTTSNGNLTVQNSSIDDAQIKSNALGSESLGSSSVGASELESGAVGSNALASGSVTEAGGELAVGAVNSSAIKDNSIATGDLAFTPATGSDLLDIQDSGGEVAADITDLKFNSTGDASVTVTGTEGGTATLEVSATDDQALSANNKSGYNTISLTDGGSIAIEDSFEANTDSNTTDIFNSGTSIQVDPSEINFAGNITASADGDGTVTVDASDTNASTECSGSNTFLSGAGGCATDTDTNTQLDDQKASSNVNMGGNNVTNAQSFTVNVTTGVTGGNGCNQAGAVVFNGSHHLGCDGSNWNAMY